MRVVYLGHAMWFVESGGLRLLFDPLLGNHFDGGVFEVSPRRRIDVRALRPDFIIVSHRHPDHFDVPSLKRLAALDPAAVVLTSDELVESAAKRLGFSSVARIGAATPVELQHIELFTTPSYGQEVEWGVMIKSPDGVIWNQVDAVHRDLDDLERNLSLAEQWLGSPKPGWLDLALVRWQPLLEVNAAIAGDIGFPRAEYANLLQQIAALKARVVAPAAAGFCHASPFGAMNRSAYPVPIERAVRDLRQLCSGWVVNSNPGTTFVLIDGEVQIEMAGGGDLVQVDAQQPPIEVFRPFELPALVDPNLGERDGDELRQVVDTWLEQTLQPAMAPLFPDCGSSDAVHLVLEVVYPDQTRAWTVTLFAGGASIARRFEDDYDLLNVVAGSFLVDVIEGRRHWGEPLLAGLLRASNRACRIVDGRLVGLNLGTIFLYYGLSYRESQERAVEHLLCS